MAEMPLRPRWTNGLTDDEADELTVASVRSSPEQRDAVIRRLHSLGRSHRDIATIVGLTVTEVRRIALGG